MQKLLLLLILSSGLLSAELVTVSGTLVHPDGSAAAGTIKIYCQQTFTNDDGERVRAGLVATSTVGSGGAVSVDLWSSDTSYRVYYDLTNADRRRTAYWTVPSGSATATIAAVETETSVDDGSTVETSQISTSGAGDTDTMEFDGSTAGWRNIDDLTEDASPDGAADFVRTWDASAGVAKKVLLDNLPGGVGGSGDITAVGNCASGACFQTAAQNQVFAGPATGGAGVAAIRALVAADIPDLSSVYSVFGHNHSGVYEPVISAGTTGQYWRGDKSWQTLNSAAVGLGSVENTALSTWAGSTSITTLGTIVTGEWTGSAIGAAYLPAFTGLTDWPAGVDATEVGYLNEVTSGIQAQLNAKITNPMTTAEDIIVGGASGTPGRLAAGSEGTVLKIVSGSVAWGTDSTGGTPAFSDVGAGTNTSAAMVVGTGASLGVSGSGTIAATSSAQLAANGANCSAGNYPLGVDASGAVESCTADDTGTDTLDDLSDDDIGALQNVTESTPGNDEVLQYVTDHWENQTLAEAGIQAAISLGTGVETWLGTPSSANLAAALTDEVGNAGGFTRGTAGSTDDCVKWDANGNLVTAGAACGSGGASLPTQTGNANKVLSTDGSTADWRAIGAGLVNDATSLRVDSSSVAMLTGTQTVAGDKTLTGDTTFSGEVDISGGTFIPASGTSLPGTCTADIELFVDSDATDGQQLYVCDAAGTGWNLVGDGGGTPGTDSVGTGELDDASDTPSAGEYVVVASTTTDVEYVTPGTGTVVAIQTVIGNGTDALSTGVAGYLEVPFACTITQITGLADQSGSAVVDVWKDSYANYPPTDADTITASAPLTLSTAIKAQDATLTGWTTSISAGDILGFNVDSATTITQLTVSIKCTR